MGITRSKNKWLAGILGLAIIVVALWAFNRSGKQSRDRQLSYNCKNKLWYDVPDMQFKGYQPIAKPVVIIKRKGEVLSNKLQLKKINDKNATVYQLAAIGSDTAIINKADTLLISLDDEQYAIYGFKSNAYYGDHHIVDCDEQYQMNGKPFRIKELNWIYSKKK